MRGPSAISVESVAWASSPMRLVGGEELGRDARATELAFLVFFFEYAGVMTGPPVKF